MRDKTETYASKPELKTFGGAGDAPIHGSTRSTRSRVAVAVALTLLGLALWAATLFSHNGAVRVASAAAVRGSATPANAHPAPTAGTFNVPEPDGAVGHVRWSDFNQPPHRVSPSSATYSYPGGGPGYEVLDDSGRVTGYFVLGLQPETQGTPPQLTRVYLPADQASTYVPPTLPPGTILDPIGDTAAATAGAATPPATAQATP